MTKKKSDSKIIKKKKCSSCKKLKSIQDFSPCKTGLYGVYNYCKECHNELEKSKKPNRKEIDEKKARRIGLKKQGLKTCVYCGKILPLEDFYGDPRHSDGKQSGCKTCFNLKGDENYLNREYGIGIKEITAMLESQDGRCAICRRAPKKNKFNVDHDHKTHMIRALLCVNCNTNLLPYVERFPEWIKAAFAYIENPPAPSVIGTIFVPETNQTRKKEKLLKGGKSVIE